MTTDEFGKLLDKIFDAKIQPLTREITTLKNSMATKDDIALLDKRLTKVEENMATKDDIALLDKRLTKVEENMATKDDIALLDKRLTKVEENMATKDDLEELKQELISELASVLENSIIKGVGKIVEENTARITRLEKHTGLPPYTS